MDQMTGQEVRFFMQIVKQHHLEDNREGKVRVWASIIGSKIINLFKVNYGIKINA